MHTMVHVHVLAQMRNFSIRWAGANMWEPGLNASRTQPILNYHLDHLVAVHQDYSIISSFFRPHPISIDISLQRGMFRDHFIAWTV